MRRLHLRLIVNLIIVGIIYFLYIAITKQHLSDGQTLFFFLCLAMVNIYPLKRLIPNKDEEENKKDDS